MNGYEAIVALALIWLIYRLALIIAANAKHKRTTRPTT